jgi:hypothetical protein
VFVTLAGVSAALTILFLSMRSVMRIGGFCASGQSAFVIAHRCPKGVPLLMLGAVWGGLVFAGLYAWQSFRSGAPSLVALLWPALFLSLGWNFLQFGLSSPEGGGAVAGWLVCAVVFILMGGIPLVAILPGLLRSPRGNGLTATSPWHFGLFPHTSLGAAASLLSTLRSATVNGASPAPQGGGQDVVGLLERLDALHRMGSLSDEEYERAKQEILRAGGS